MTSTGSEEAILQAAQIIANSRFVIAFTGAGISAESGIPTFRGKDGLWSRYKPEELATPEAFNRNPKLVWEWYRWRLEIILSAAPNPAHYALAELERMGILKCVITQNVDELHRAAGNECVVELHGSIRRVRCTSCGYKFRIDSLEQLKELPPRCPVCNSLLRPDVVWFGEPLPEDAWFRALRLVEQCDTMIVVGTSGVVYPAAYLPYLAKNRGATIIEINIEPSALTPIADVFIRCKASIALSRIVEEVKKFLRR